MKEVKEDLNKLRNINLKPKMKETRRNLYKIKKKKSVFLNEK